MKEKISKRRGGDNALEDYFLELVIKKHVIDREIKDLLIITEKSPLHTDYQTLVKKVLFGEKNIYIEHWGTLEGSLLDMMKTGDLRSNHTSEHGVILEMMVNVIETVFNVEDELMYLFLLSEDKEDIEHQVILLMKRMLDFAEQGLRDMLSQATHLANPIDGHIRKEFTIIQQTLLKYPEVILQEQKGQIEALKQQIEVIRSKLIAKKNTFSHLAG